MTNRRKFLSTLLCTPLLAIAGSAPAKRQQATHVIIGQHVTSDIHVLAGESLVLNDCTVAPGVTVTIHEGYEFFDIQNCIFNCSGVVVDHPGGLRVKYGGA